MSCCVVLHMSRATGRRVVRRLGSGLSSSARWESFAATYGLPASFALQAAVVGAAVADGSTAWLVDDRSATTLDDVADLPGLAETDRRQSRIRRLAGLVAAGRGQPLHVGPGACAGRRCACDLVELAIEADRGTVVLRGPCKAVQLTADALPRAFDDLADDPRLRPARTIVDDVRRLAGADPGRVAVADHLGRTVTRAQLVERVLDSAQRLGSGPGDRVVVSAVRSLDFVVEVLACWHRGAVPVLVDETTAPEVVAAALGQGPRTADHVLLTSGTSGLPVPVVMPTGSLAFALDVYQAEIGIGPGDVFLFLAPPDHDPVFRDAFLPLRVGARLVIPDPSALSSPASTAAAVANSRATVLHMTPSRWSTLLPFPDLMGSVSTVVLHGEPPGSGLVDATAHVLPSVRLVNAYGLTETSQVAAWGDLGPGPTGQVVQAARRTPHRVLRLVDEHDGVGTVEVLGYGTSGPPPRDGLWAHGIGVVNSGDLAMQSGEGLVVVGRHDRRVNVHGTRVELAGIESAALEVAGVRGAIAIQPIAGEPVRLWLQADGVVGEQVMRHLRNRLPDAAIPAQVTIKATLPMTGRGKVNITQMAQAAQDHVDDDPRQVDPDTVLAVVRDVLGSAAATMTATTKFDAVGMTSLDVFRVGSRLAVELRADVTATDVFSARDSTELAVAIAARTRPSSQVRVSSRRRDDHGRPDGIAVVGMAVRAPDAPDAPTLWRNLLAGQTSIHRLNREELAAAGVPRSDLDDPRYLPFCPLLDDVWGIDLACFGLTERDALVRSPQHRLLLELVHTALHDAGHALATTRRVGLFAGAGPERYERRLRGTFEARMAGSLGIELGNEPDYLSTFVSHRLGLTGPSVTVQTACSTALVAVHQAAQALRAGDCDVAVAGAVDVKLPYGRGYRAVRGAMLSTDGVCRPLDARASGTVFGSGGAVLVLRRLADAIADRDAVDAVILGSALNNDGDRRSTFTSPSPQGQREVITAALASAGVDAGAVGFVELHGTGTPIGDPVEVEALVDAYGTTAAWSRSRPRAIGSVKSNLGHLGAAAGALGLVKAVLAVRDGAIPGTANLEQINPALALDPVQWSAPRETEVWPTEDQGPRTAGVSSFGFGGTNTHALVTEHRSTPRAEGDTLPHLIVWSGADDAALDVVRDAISATDPRLPLADVAWTLLSGWRVRGARAYAVCRETAELAGLTASRTAGPIDFNGLKGSASTRWRALDAMLAAHSSPRDAVRSLLRQLGVFDEPTWGRDGGDPIVAILEHIGAAWQRGREIHIEHLPWNRNPSRVHLAPYPYSRTEHVVGASS